METSRVLAWMPPRSATGDTSIGMAHWITILHEVADFRLEASTVPQDHPHVLGSGKAMDASDAELAGAVAHVTGEAPSAAAPTTGKAKGRARARPVRPRIDLDEQITQANKLAEVSKKMLSAARMAQRNQKKQKQRLIRKAGKLSAEDLERIAVLKRCGLYADEQDEGSGSGIVKNPAANPDEAPVTGPSDKKVKLSDVVQKIAGAEVVLDALGHGSLSSASAAGATSGHGSIGAVSGGVHQDGRPRGSRLLRVLSRTSTRRLNEEAEHEDHA